MTESCSRDAHPDERRPGHFFCYGRNKTCNAVWPSAAHQLFSEKAACTPLQRGPLSVAPGVTWHRARGPYLVPVRAYSVGFRERVLRRLTRVLPDMVVPAPVWKTPWVVYAKSTGQGADRVLRCLARDIHRAAITDARILRVDARRGRFAIRTHGRTRGARGRSRVKNSCGGSCRMGCRVASTTCAALAGGARRPRPFAYGYHSSAPPRRPVRACTTRRPTSRAQAPCGAHCGIGHLVRTRRLLRTHTATRDLTRVRPQSCAPGRHNAQSEWPTVPCTPSPAT